MKTFQSKTKTRDALQFASGIVVARAAPQNEEFMRVLSTANSVEDIVDTYLLAELSSALSYKSLALPDRTLLLGLAILQTLMEEGNLSQEDATKWWERFVFCLPIGVEQEKVDIFPQLFRWLLIEPIDNMPSGLDKVIQV